VNSERGDILGAHLAEPEIDIDRHVRRRLLKAGTALLGKRKLYLDTNFWVAMRKAALGTVSGDAVRLLGALRSGVAEGWLVCPLSEAIFIELFNQSDLSTRAATAELMANLSGNFALLDPEARLATEVMHFFRKSFGADVHDMQELVWTKAAFIFGTVHPVPHVEFPPELVLALQKSVFDDLWSQSLVAMVDALAGCAMGRGADYDALAAELNAANAAHADELRSFVQAYRAEASGIATMFPHVAVAALGAFAEDSGLTVPSGREGERALASVGARVLTLILTKKRDPGSLRSLHVQASLHATARWNKTQRLDAHDLLDFQHAAAALAYCDGFLTDGPMRTMIQQKHLALDAELGCRVASSLGEALTLVGQLRPS
jgi:hypothetical protein